MMNTVFGARCYIFHTNVDIILNPCYILQRFDPGDDIWMQLNLTIQSTAVHFDSAGIRITTRNFKEYCILLFGVMNVNVVRDCMN
jgi:hypothetical protein